MAKQKDDAPSNARVISKAAALACCSDAMTKVCRNVCYGVPRAGEWHVADDAEAAALAAALGSGVVLVGTRAGPVIQGVATRIAIFRISTALITSSLAASSAQAVGAFAIEHVTTTGGSAIQKVAAPILNGNPIKASGVIIEVASKLQKAAPMVGESVFVKAISKAAVQYVVVGEVISVLQKINQELRGDNVAKDVENELRDCCDVVTKSFNRAWKQAPVIFHRASYQTTNKGRRSHGRKASRRN